ncbi:MAG: Gldg family protein [Thermodesulfobacteriota bacterium]
MLGKKFLENYFKFIVYVVVIILVNLVGLTLFARFDLTENNIYSLSPASQNAVSTLSEPLTINVFFTENLPAPHNNTKRYLRDILEEYGISANENFNYRFYNVSPEGTGGDESTEKNRQLAQNYGIQPVQIRSIEADEMQFKNAYMGLVIIHGDLMERIPAITSTDGLEYKLTTAIQKLNNKISALASLPEKIDTKLIMSSGLNKVGPQIGAEQLPELPDRIEETVSELNEKNYNKLTYEYIDPDRQNNLDELQEKYDIMTLQWPSLEDAGIDAGTGGIGMVMSYGDQTRTIRLLNVYRVPMVGTQYELIDMATLEETINENLETLIGINEDLGYLADHGTPEVSGPMARMQQQQQQSQMKNFQSLVSQNYTLKQIELKENTIADSLNCLVIAQPTKEFTDYELYQIDQALMRGTNVAVFSDAFEEVQDNQNQQQRFNRGPSFQRLDTGLEKLLAHYGITIEDAYVLDKNAYEQDMSRQGGGKQPIYFAPIIKNKNINHELGFMENIKQLVTMKNAPVTMDAETMDQNDLTAHKLLSSSSQSWLMRDQIRLNPMMIRPPQSAEKYESYPLAYLVEGRFPSYFQGKKLPEKQTDAAEGEDQPGKPETKAAEGTIDTSKIESKNRFIEKGRPAKLLVVGSSALLKDNLLDEKGQTPNAAFVLNAIDALNGRTEIAAMRSKTQRFNPLEETTAATKSFVKFFNIAGLPALVIVFGLFVWWGRRIKRKRIRMMFRG